MSARSAHPPDPQTSRIIGSAIEVHQLLGHGFLEGVYREALGRLLDEAAIPYQAEVQLPIMFKGRPLQTVYRADLVCYGEIIVELKALRALRSSEEGQVLNYLKASGLRRALLINFGGRRLEIRRFVGPDAPFSVSSVSSVDVPSVSSVDAFAGPQAPSMIPSVSSVDRPSLPPPPV